MKGHVIGLLILLAGTHVSVAAADVKQTTGEGSWCSPAQNGNNNQVRSRSDATSPSAIRALTGPMSPRR
jgi:hypothetical protein